jgi:hypothetical protein
MIEAPANTRQALSFSEKYTAPYYALVRMDEIPDYRKILMI